MNLVIYRRHTRSNPYYEVLREVECYEGLFTKQLVKRYIQVPHYILSEEHDDGEDIIYVARSFKTVKQAQDAIKEYIKLKDEPLPEDGIVATIEL